MNDIFTDFVADPVDYRNGKVHDGILKVTYRLKTKLEAPLIEAIKQYPKLPVIFTGHSLGAGSAVSSSLFFLKKPNPNDLIQTFLLGYLVA